MKLLIQMTKESSQIPEDRLWRWECVLCWFCIQSSVTGEGRKEVCGEIHEEVDPLYPHAQTHIPAHHQTRSQEASRVFWTASHPQHLLKRIFGDKQTNRATFSYVETCIFLTTWLSWPWNFWEVLPLPTLYFFLMLLYLVTAHIIRRQRKNCSVSALRCCSIIKSCPTLWPHGLQHARLPCPSLSPGVCSNSCPLSQWCHSTISSSVAPSLPGLSLSQQEDLFQWVDFSNQVAKVLVSVTVASIYTPTNSA